MFALALCMRLQLSSLIQQSSTLYCMICIIISSVENQSALCCTQHCSITWVILICSVFSLIADYMRDKNQLILNIRIWIPGLQCFAGQLCRNISSPIIEVLKWSHVHHQNHQAAVSSPLRFQPLSTCQWSSWSPWNHLSELTSCLSHFASTSYVYQQKT